MGARGEAAGQKERKHESAIKGTALDLKTPLLFFGKVGIFPAHTTSSPPIRAALKQCFSARWELYLVSRPKVGKPVKTFLQKFVFDPFIYFQELFLEFFLRHGFAKIACCPGLKGLHDVSVFAFCHYHEEGCAVVFRP